MKFPQTNAFITRFIGSIIVYNGKEKTNTLFKEIVF